MVIIVVTLFFSGPHVNKKKEERENTKKIENTMEEY